MNRYKDGGRVREVVAETGSDAPVPPLPPPQQPEAPSPRESAGGGAGSGGGPSERAAPPAGRDTAPGGNASGNNGSAPSQGNGNPASYGNSGNPAPHGNPSPFRGGGGSVLPETLRDLKRGFDGVLRQLDPRQWEVEDLLIAGILYLLYRESGDSEWLIVLLSYLFL